jgi:hypothetical protein
VSLILIELHNVVEEIVLPGFREAFTFRGKESQILSTSSALRDLRIKRDLEMQEIGATSKPLFATKSCHQHGPFTTGHGNHDINLTLAFLHFVIWNQGGKKLLTITRAGARAIAGR